MSSNDIVYIYSYSSSKWRGQELRFSLRSLEKYGRNFRDIVIVGDKPIYINDGKINHIPCGNKQGNKERAIYEKLLIACKEETISDPFIAFQDDYFLVKEIDFSKLKYFYCNTLEERLSKRTPKDIYWHALQNTLSVLDDKSLSTKHFDIHYPIKYHKEKFIEVMTGHDWTIKGGYVIKSLYANSLKIKGEQKKDAKIFFSRSKKNIKEVIRSTDLFSTDKISREMGETFLELYPDKSQYEEL